MTASNDSSKDGASLHSVEADAIHQSTRFGIGDRRSQRASELLQPGTVVAGYTVEAPIGVGGMARVYRAMQAKPRRTIALKVLDWSLLTPLVAARFEHEVSMLARLRHPHVAHVYEAGIASGGEAPIPYIAMELVVDGEPITRFAVDRGLTCRDRMMLFRNACEAVAHAHERGVIHRDIKPGNILVDSAGQPKLIDFGIAESLADSERDHNRAPATGAGTLQYMSPEQFSGDAAEIDTRSDVYSMGMVLHELLAGRPPYITEGLDDIAVTRIATAGATPLLPAGTDRRLVAIVARCLSRRREDRYATAADLAADVRRYLDDEAVMAASEGAFDMLIRSVRRHRAAGVLTAAGLLLTVGLIAGLVVLVIQVVQERTSLVSELERVRGEARDLIKERDRADRAQKTMLAIMATFTPNGTTAGADPAAKLNEAYESLDKSLDARSRAAALGTIGRGFARIGMVKDAARILEQAVALRQEVDGPDAESTRADLRSVIDAHMAAENPQQAHDAWEQLLAWHRRVNGPEHDITMSVMLEMAMYMAAPGRWPERAIDLARAVRDGRLKRSQSVVNRISAEKAYLNVLAQARRDSQVLEEVGHLLPSLEELAEKSFGNYVESLHDLAQVVQEADGELAIELHARALSGNERRFGTLHTATIMSRHRHALAHRGAPERLPRYYELLSDVLAQQRAAFGSASPAALGTIGQLGEAARAFGKHDEAVTLLREAYERRVSTIGPDAPATVRAELALAGALLDAGLTDQAEPLVRHSLAMFERMYGSRHQETQRARTMASRLASEARGPATDAPMSPGS